MAAKVRRRIDQATAKEAANALAAGGPGAKLVGITAGDGPEGLAVERVDGGWQVSRLVLRRDADGRLSVVGEAPAPEPLGIDGAAVDLQRACRELLGL